MDFIYLMFATSLQNVQIKGQYLNANMIYPSSTYFNCSAKLCYSCKSSLAVTRSTFFWLPRGQF